MSGKSDLNKPSKQNYGTPTAFMRAVYRAFNRGPFLIDMACSQENKKAVHAITKEDDALSFDWNDLYEVAGVSIASGLWLNPPFSQITPWAKKCATFTASELFLLVPASVASRWFLDYVAPNSVWYSVTPRIPFDGAPTDAKGRTLSIDRDCILCHFNSGTVPRWGGEFNHKEGKIHGY